MAACRYCGGFGWDDKERCYGCGATIPEEEYNFWCEDEPDIPEPEPEPIYVPRKPESIKQPWKKEPQQGWFDKMICYTFLGIFGVVYVGLWAIAIGLGLLLITGLFKS